jgi:hypothetical protein
MPTITPLRRAPGADTGGIASGRPLDAGTEDLALQIPAGHLLLVSSDQSLTPAELFGPSMRQHDQQHSMPDYRRPRLVWRCNGQQRAKRWHTGHVIDNQATMRRAHRDHDRRESQILQPGIVDGGRPVPF